MRVAYFAGTMRPGHDGVTRVLYRWIEGLQRAGMPHLFFSPIVPLPGECSTPMIKVPSVAFPLYTDYRFAIPGYRHFEERLRAFQPDLLHINSPCSLGLAALKYGQKYEIPVVATYHTHFASYAKYYRVKALEAFSWNYFRRLYNGCDRVYVPSQPILDELLRHGLTSVEHLPHGVDTRMFDPGYRDTAWKARLNVEGKKVLLYVGRLVWEKDLRVLAEAYRMISRRRSDLALVLVGEGPIRSALESLMPGAVFVGQQSGSELATSYASSDAFIFPSRTETFGNVTMEAMASGLPPVCVSEGGAAGIIENGVTGLLAAPGDPADLAARAEFLLDHPTERLAMATEALAYARRQKWERVIDRMFAGYTEVMTDAADRFFHKHRKAA